MFSVWDFTQSIGVAQSDAAGEVIANAFQGLVGIQEIKLLNVKKVDRSAFDGLQELRSM